ncbi:hypothetical protein [Metallosphaera sp.]|uniref:hypothetical protein n=1 Tax=Metallosphaera sp. TaxID=2020860 RepID=UPI00317D9FCD
MDGSSAVKICAIAGLVAMEIANLLTLQKDGAILVFVSGLIGGIAGYEYGKGKRR